MFRVFPRKGINRRKGNVGGRLWGPHPMAAWPRGAAPPRGVAALLPLFDSPPDFVYVTEK